MRTNKCNSEHQQESGEPTEVYSKEEVEKLGEAEEAEQIEIVETGNLGYNAATTVANNYNRGAWIIYDKMVDWKHSKP